MPNRLSEELSPYLLQHQNNPVDWYPWGKDAFDKAIEEDKPIFLSIGYATCHWCHVMEHESFEDKEVASLLNEVFVPVKVDREERPDIDQVYMTYCQLSTGHGGWPLTILMTPGKEPFFAGTYIPKHSRHGRIGMLDLIPRVQGIWASRREEVLESARNNTEILSKASDWAIDTSVPGKSVLSHAYRQLSENFDPVHGGFGTAPKFPSPHQLLFLTDYHKWTGEESALEMVKTTLRNMRLGGVFDQVGYGFHRYSTDAEWLLPHFEKMLYDQAMIALAAIETYDLTGELVYKEIADRIFEYVFRDMVAPEGGFYSAEDADSEGEEGKFYVWNEDEINAVLPEEQAKLFKEYFQFSSSGNFADEVTGVRTGNNIPHLSQSLLSLDEHTQATLEEARKTLFALREERIHPLKDDKVLTDWNGLMIVALARYAQLIDSEEQEHLNRAKAALRFVKENLYSQSGGLLHRYREGVAGIPGNLDDYAFMAWGLIELYHAEFDVDHLAWAVELTDQMILKFWDEENGGFYFSPSDGEALIARTKEAYDGAIPSGNSVALLNLLRLARMTGNVAYEERADQMLKMFGAPIRRQPSGFTAMLLGLSFALNESYEIVVAGEKGSEKTKTLLDTIRKASLPHMVLLLKEGKDTQLENLASYTSSMQAPNGETIVYVCRDFQCNTPVNDPSELATLLRKEDS